MFHKLLHSRPEPLSECLFQYASATSARSRRKPFQLLLPHTRTTRYRESFFYRSALLWNSLPHDIQSLKNSKSFRDALENHYQSYKFTTTENFHIPHGRTQRGFEGGSPNPAGGLGGAVSPPAGSGAEPWKILQLTLFRG